MLSRKRALAAAKWFRTCPPLEIRNDSAQSAMWEAHRRICPLCAEEDHEYGAFEVLANALYREAAGFQAPGPSPMEPGQLRSIRPERACWRDGFYYRPPLVLVSALSECLSEAVQVVQVYPDPVLAAPGDLILDEDRSPVGEIIVECWNVYTLRRSDLGPSVGNLAPDVLAAVVLLAEDSSATPDWAPLPMPMHDEFDPRVYFREMETEVGYVFSAPAAIGLLAEIESDDEKINAKIVELKKTLKTLSPGISLSENPASEKETLLLARFAEDQLPLAAATRGAKKVVIKCAVKNDSGELVSFAPLEAEIQEESIAEGKRIISGWLSDIPDVFRDAAIHMGLRGPDNTLLFPENLDLDMESGLFTAGFPNDLGEGYQLEMVLEYKDS